MTILKLARLALRMKQTDLALVTGIPRWRISLAEMGCLGLTPQEVDILAGNLGVRRDALLRTIDPSKITLDAFYE